MLGNKLSFFKKNKSKKVEKAAKPSPKAIKKDVEHMDRDLNLDQEIENLTSQLNMSPEDGLDIQTEKPTLDTPPVGLGAIGSINQELSNYKEPSLNTHQVKTGSDAEQQSSTPLPSSQKDSPCLLYTSPSPRDS